jgi:hypothetical protein
MRIKLIHIEVEHRFILGTNPESTSNLYHVLVSPSMEAVPPE